MWGNVVVFFFFIRHSITKMSHLHFVATDEYAKRVIQLGEEPNRVFSVGGMGIENIKKLKLLSKEEFEKSIDFKLNKKNILITLERKSVVKGKSVLDWVDRGCRLTI